MNRKRNRYINTANVILLVLLSLLVYFVAGTVLINLKERYYNIFTHSDVVIGIYLFLISVMFLCSTVIFVCGILLWKYDAIEE